MMNRRFLRVKVMQSLYATIHSDGQTFELKEKQLLKDIEGLTEVYFSLLDLAHSVSEYTLIVAEERSKKLIPSEVDKNMGTSFAQNDFVKALQKSVTYTQAVKKSKINWNIDPEIVPSLFRHLFQSDAYSQYLLEGKGHELKALKQLLLKTIMRSDAVEQLLEIKCITWEEDKEVIKIMLSKTIKNFEDGKADFLVKLSLDPKEDEAFIHQMFIKFDKEGSDLEAKIAKRIANWDVDRIAVTDIILMKMILVEALYFPKIPVNVSINEYMEIAKIYSTPKSATFINGILDPVCKDLLQQGLIKKTR